MHVITCRRRRNMSDVPEKKDDAYTGRTDGGGWDGAGRGEGHEERSREVRADRIL